MISFRIDWLDLLAVRGTLKSLLQHHSSKASILQPSAFFTVPLSHPQMTIVSRDTAEKFIRRTDAEAETTVLWPPDAKNRLIGKDPDTGKD